MFNVQKIMGDIDMFLFIGKGIRDGVSYIALKNGIKIDIEYKYI